MLCFDLQSRMEELNTIPLVSPTRIKISSSNWRSSKILKKEAYGICRTDIPQSYITNTFNNYSYAYVYKNDIGKIIGFVVWKERITHSLVTPGKKYIDLLLICALKGLHFSPYMLYDLEEYADQNDFEEIYLEPMNDKLVRHYMKFGYIILSKGPKVMMGKIIKPPKKNITTRRKTRKRGNVLTEYISQLPKNLQNSETITMLTNWNSKYLNEKEE